MPDAGPPVLTCAAARGEPEIASVPSGDGLHLRWYAKRWDDSDPAGCGWCWYDPGGGGSAADCAGYVDVRECRVGIYCARDATGMAATPCDGECRDCSVRSCTECLDWVAGEGDGCGRCFGDTAIALDCYPWIATQRVCTPPGDAARRCP